MRMKNWTYCVVSRISCVAYDYSIKILAIVPVELSTVSKYKFFVIENKIGLKNFRVKMGHVYGGMSKEKNG